MRMMELFTGSFYSASLYRRVRGIQGFLMGYALLVVMLTTASAVLYYGYSLHRELFMEHNGNAPVFDDVVEQIAEQVPVMTWKDQTLITRDPEPTTIRITAKPFGVPFENFPLVVIDTSGRTTHENMQASMLITNKEFIVRSEKETKIQPLTEYADQAPATVLINRAVALETGQKIIGAVHHNLAMIYSLLGIFAFCCFTAFTFVMRMFMLLALGLAGKLIGLITNAPVDYTTAVRLAAVSYTPVALLDTLLFLWVGFAPLTLALFAAGVVALFAAMQASKPAKDTPAC